MWLQRGRVPEHAEGDEALRLMRARLAGFNGAACRSTRKGRKRYGAAVAVTMLQRGRVPEHAEGTLASTHPTLLDVTLQRGRVPEHAEGSMRICSSIWSGARLQRGRVPEHAEGRCRFLPTAC